MNNKPEISQGRTKEEILKREKFIDELFEI